MEYSVAQSDFCNHTSILPYVQSSLAAFLNTLSQITIYTRQLILWLCLVRYDTCAELVK